LAVVVTVAKGYDLGYIWKTQDHTAERTTGGYYLNAAQTGEPPAAGGDPEPRPSASPPDKPSNALPTTRYTGRPTRAPAPGSAGPVRRTPRAWGQAPRSGGLSRIPPRA
jgi:hypothetical protein